jgi:hypothetical protein
VTAGSTTACLCFGLDLDEQQRSGFGYCYSIYQVEYSRNLLFKVGAHHHHRPHSQHFVDRRSASS